MADGSLRFDTRIDTSGFTKGLSSMASSATKYASIAIAAGATAAAGLVGTAVKSYAEYEQLIGGVDTLFKDSSGAVQQYAANAYKTAGMSANDYMSTVTAFSASLLQALDGDTAAASKAADQAVTDMSDNANKMGTSMELIQNAYQGFAKQNYTMLDNLKLGYGGTKEEMERLLSDAQEISGVKYDISNLNDVYSAIHVVQTELGITGTTAKEASTTIEGSVNMMKASWSNLVTGMADDNADFDTLVSNFVESAATVAENLLPRIETAITGVGALIEKLLPVIVQNIPAVISNILPSLVNAGIDMVKSIITGFSNSAGSLVSSMMGLIQPLLTKVGELIPDFINLAYDIAIALATGLAEQAPTLIPVAIDIVMKILDTFIANIPLWLEAGVQLLLGLAEGLMNAIPELISKLPSIMDSIVDGLLYLLPVLIDGAIQLVNGVVAAIPTIIQSIINALPQLISSIINFLITAIPQLVEGAIQLFMALVTAIPTIVVELLNALPQIVDAIIEGLSAALPFFEDLWQGIQDIFSTVVEVLGGIFSAAWAVIQEVWSVVTSFFGTIWDVIKGIFSAVTSVLSGDFSGAWEAIKGIWNSVVGFFGDVWNGICGVFSGVASWFGGTFRSAWDAICNAFSAVGSFFGDLWSNIVSRFTDIGVAIGDAVGGAFKGIVNGVLSTAENIVNGFFGLINGAIGAINEIPGVNISKIELVSFPRLAKGGVLKKGQVGFLEGDGDEAVIPLSQNKEWIGNVAKEMRQSMDSGSTANNQTINIYQPVKSPSETARAIKVSQKYGLAGM